ncbi:MAG: methyltransferase domain-containing protein [Acidobacteria bacterium]|nr:methyltransferase domain-containing protein [Acidobacteriota bacterium]
MNRIPEPMLRYRNLVADQFLRGEGIEIGALDSPLQTRKRETEVRYLDYQDNAALRATYPEIDPKSVVRVDLVDDGETMATVPDESVDFIVANHFLEHCMDPTGTLRTHLRKIREKGVLFYSVPDKRSCFDVNRPPTPLRHLLADALDGGRGTRVEHYAEWERLVNRTPEDQIDQRVEELIRIDYKIHFHVFEMENFRVWVDSLCQYWLHADLENLSRNHTELLLVLRKLPAPGASPCSRPGEPPCRPQR